MKNPLTDIAGVRVGHADDARPASGVTAVIFDAPAIAAIDVRGGGPGPSPARCRPGRIASSSDFKR
jgi:D-aminopeptidase